MLPTLLLHSCIVNLKGTNDTIGHLIFIKLRLLKWPLKMGQLKNCERAINNGMDEVVY